MIGLSSDLQREHEALCTARGWSLADVLSRRVGSPELRLRYRRPNGDVTSALPSSRHLDYVSKGWTAVQLIEDQAASPADLPPVPPAIVDLAAMGKRGVFRKGELEATLSLAEYSRLLGKGWQFVALEDEERARAIAEARLPADGRQAQSRPVLLTPDGARSIATHDSGPR